jgi:hypothetical protein
MSHTDLYFQSRIKRSGYLLYVADGGFVAEKENERITGRTISAVFRKIYYTSTNKKSAKK